MGFLGQVRGYFPSWSSFVLTSQRSLSIYLSISVSFLFALYFSLTVFLSFSLCLGRSAKGLCWSVSILPEGVGSFASHQSFSLFLPLLSVTFCLFFLLTRIVLTGTLWPGVLAWLCCVLAQIVQIYPPIMCCRPGLSARS